MTEPMSDSVVRTTIPHGSFQHDNDEFLQRWVERLW
jgi:hypothetical protein